MSETIRNAANNIDRGYSLKNARLIKSFFGRDGLKTFHQVLRTGDEPNVGVVDQLNAVFFERVKEVYEVPSFTTPEKFFEDQMVAANSVVETVIGKYLANSQGYLNLRDEVESFDPYNPFSLLRYLAPERDRVTGKKLVPDKTLSFQVIRQFKLAAISADFESRSLNGDLKHKLSQIQRCLRRELFEGGAGSTTTRTVLTIHDNATNRFKSFQECKATYTPEEDPDVHLKEIPLHVRQLRSLSDDEEPRGVMEKMRSQKNRAEAILKAIRRAKGGEINPIRYVTDECGIVYVTEDDKQRSLFLRRLSDALVTCGIAQDIIPDEDTNGEKDQKSPAFVRLKIEYAPEGVPENRKVPIEFIVYSLPDYIRSIYEVGEQDPESQFFDGAAHALYEIRRTYNLLAQLFPEDIYDRRVVKVEELCLIRMNQIAEGLRNRDRNRES